MENMNLWSATVNFINPHFTLYGHYLNPRPLLKDITRLSYFVTFLKLFRSYTVNSSILNAIELHLKDLNIKICKNTYFL